MPVRAQNFQGLGFVPGFDLSAAAGVSADGTTVVGDIRPIGNNSNGSSQAFSWTASSGMNGLGYLPGQDMSRALGVSADGSTVAGYGQLLNSGTGALAFRWTPATGLVALGNLPVGPNDNFATAANADGSVIVGGAAAAGCCGAQAFRWTASTGMIGLNNLPGATGAVANGVSADGSVVVGYSSNNQAFQWTATTGSVGLGFLPGSVSSQAIAVSANGAVVTGVSVDSTTHDQTFRWTATTGMAALGSLAGATFTTPRAVNADGSVIVGTSGGVNFQPFRWTQTTGMQSIRDTLIAGGYGPIGWTLQTANGVSADGTVIVGNGIDPDGKIEAWLARIPVNAFALLDLKGLDLSIGSLVWGGVVTNSGPGAATLRAGSDNSSTIFIGTITDGAGPTALIKEGTGTLTLSGANSYTGPTSVNAGTLSVNGSIASSSLTIVNSGATLVGNGIIGNTTINGGTLSPGNSIGTLTVQGNLVFTAASSYMVEVSPSNADRTNVTGTATLGTATVSANFAAGTYVAKQYTIVSAGGGVIGTFGPLVNTNLPSGFRSSLSYDSGHAYLDLSLNFAPVSGLNGNQQSVGNALTNFFNSNGSIPILFGALTPAGLTQASGETATGAQQTTFNAMTQFLGALLDPFIGGRGDTSAPAAGAGPFAEDDDAARAYASQGRKRSGTERAAYGVMTKAAPRNPAFDPRWSVWTAGFGGSQTTDGNAVVGSNSTTSRIFGAAIGADYLFSPRTIAGFALAGGGTNFSVANGGSGRSDLFQAGAFIRHTAGNAYISGALAYGWQDVTTDRTVTIAGVDRLRAKFSANAFSGRVEGGYRFVAPWVGGIGITPYAAGQFTTFDLPAYAEQVVSGANNFALAYAAKSVTASRSELGLRADKSLAMPNAILTLRGRAAWAHDFNADRNIAATFQTLPGASFVVNGAAQGRDAALTTASAEMKWLNGFSIAAVFEGEFSDVTRSYAGKGVARYAW
jgi:autotransporter-associated beta strand protein/probable HAF family extracellular repeat protein